ncbi:MAG TPA: hypothetical protein VN786_09260, partial [Acidimicrobiales bacterium]|nr:hypothetical protein [Acidimicrobiales bacterium]
SKEALDAPLSPPPLDGRPGPATGLSGVYPDGTLTRRAGPVFRTHHGSHARAIERVWPYIAAAGARKVVGTP